MNDVRRNDGRRRCESAGRSAFTLIEVLLTLGVLTMIAALAVPPMADLLSDRRAARGVDLVQTELAATRLDAMRHGRVFTVSIGPTPDRLVAAPLASLADAIESDGDAGVGRGLLSGADAGPMTAAAGVAETIPPRDIEMPEGVTVSRIVTAGDLRDAIAGSSGMSMASNLTADATTNPVSAASLFFYPDGTTSNGAVELASTDAPAAAVLIRGVDGRTEVVGR